MSTCASRAKGCVFFCSPFHRITDVFCAFSVKAACFFVRPSIESLVSFVRFQWSVCVYVCMYLVRCMLLNQTRFVKIMSILIFRRVDR